MPGHLSLLGAGGSGALLAPATTGLAAWFKADGVDSAGKADSDPWPIWTDEAPAGNLNDVTQGTAANRPLYRTNQINGKPSIVFDGVNDYMDNVFPAGLNGTGETLWMVASMADTTAYLMGIVTRPTFNEFRKKGPGTNTALQILFAGGTTPSVQVADIGINTYFIGCATFDDATNAVRLYANNTQVGSSSDAGAFSDTVIRIGSRDGATLFWKGGIAEVLIYNAAQSSGDRNTTATYLGQKYGITVA